MWCSGVNPACRRWSTNASLRCHRRIDLPRDQHRLLARRAQVRQADEGPFRLGAHVHQLRLRIGAQGFPYLRRRHILDHLDTPAA